MEKIDICIQNNLKGLGPIETTQFFRGDVFYALDEVMGRTYEPNEADYFENSIKFVKKILELIVHYLKLVPDMLKAFNEEKVSSDLYLVDENIAIIKCLPEFTETLKTIFCQNARCLRFYLRYDRAPEEPKTNICKPFKERDFEVQKMKMEDLQFDEIRELMFKTRELNFGLFHEFLDYFQQLEGFSHLRRALKCIVPSEGNLTLPLDLIPLFTSPYKNCVTIINPEYAREMCEELQSIIIGRLENMTDEEMKDIDKNTTNSILGELREFLCIGLDHDSVDEKLESIKLSMALRFLRSTNMKKRLNGINEIKSIIEMTASSMRKGWHEDESPSRARWLKPEYLCRWIQDNHLVEYLLGDSSHVEVIKRSTTVLKFLSHYKQLTKDHLELLWKSQEDKHEATVLGVYEAIIDISNDLDKDALDFIYSRIESIPLKKYNEQTLNFVKDFTNNACRSAAPPSKQLIDLSSDEEDEKHGEYFLKSEGRKKPDVSERRGKGWLAEVFENFCEHYKNKSSEDMEDLPPHDQHCYGIPRIYELTQQSSPLGTAALKALLEVLKDKSQDYFKCEYVFKSIENLQKGRYTYQSLTILTSVLPKCFPAKSYDRKSMLQAALVRLNDTFDLISLTVQNIQRYNEVVQKQMIDSIDKGVVSENISKT